MKMDINYQAISLVMFWWPPILVTLHSVLPFSVALYMMEALDQNNSMDGQLGASGSLEKFLF